MSFLIHWLNDSQTYFQQLGWMGVLAYAGVIVVAQTVMTPLSPFAIAGGFIFGFQGGFCAITLGTAIGGTINFWIARYGAREAIAHRIRRNEKFRLIDDAIGKEGWRIVVLLRFCPIPYGFSNYAYGLTAIPFGPYLLATVCAIIPANLLFVWMGTSAQSGLEAALGTNRPHHPMEYVLLGLGLTAGFVALAYVGKIARTTISKSNLAAADAQ